MDYFMDVLSGILIPYIYTIRVLLARKTFHEENFLQGKFFFVTLMYSFRYYSIDYIAVIPTQVNTIILDEANRRNKSTTAVWKFTENEATRLESLHRSGVPR